MGISKERNDLVSGYQKGKGQNCGGSVTNVGVEKPWDN